MLPDNLSLETYLRYRSVGLITSILRDHFWLVGNPYLNLVTCGVEMWRGGVGAAYLLPALSSAGASLASPCFRFHIPLIEPDGRISRVRLSEKGSRCRPREMARPPAKAD